MLLVGAPSITPNVTMLDVTALVQQMRDTLSEIHDTITSLDTKGHDEKLDALESQRDEVFPTAVRIREGVC